MEQQPAVTLKDRFWTQATRTDVVVSLATALLSTGILTSVAQRWAEVTGGSWPASIFMGLGATCVLALVVSFYLIAFRKFKPLPPGLSPNIAIGEPTLDIWERVSNVNTTMVNLFKHSDASLAKVESNLDSQIAAVNQRIESAAKSLRYENTMLQERILALKTIYEMRQLKRDIVRLITLLDRPLRQPIERRDWTDWGNRFLKFNKAIRRFAHLAAMSYPDEASNLTWIDPGIFRIDEGDFALAQFPDLQTAHDFKTFRHMSSAYESLGEGFMDRTESKT
jgi:hypothetical protein